MDGILEALATAVERDGRAAVATVVRTWRSAPMPAGTSMLVTAAGEITGSVSAGCVEAELALSCTDVLADGRPRLVRYGVTNDEAFAVGLMCGGEIEVLVECIRDEEWSVLDHARRERAVDEPVAIATVIDGPLMGTRLVAGRSVAGSLGASDLDARVVERSRALLERAACGVHLDVHTGMQVFIETLAPRPRLVIVGSSEYAAALSTLGRQLDFTVTVIDPRPAFTTQRRLPNAHAILVDWPGAAMEGLVLGPRDAVVVLTHDERIDVPALRLALRSGAGFVGAMGSRATHAQRTLRLADAGLEPDDIARIHSPVGLDIAGVTPMETAVSIAAEVIANRSGRAGAPLGEHSHGGGQAATIHARPQE